MKIKKSWGILFSFCVLLCIATTAGFAQEVTEDSKEVEVSTWEGVKNIISDLNAGTKSEAILVLENDVEAPKESKYSDTTLSKGTLTIHGEGHKLTMKNLALTGSASVYLGREDYTKTLTITSSEDIYSIIDLSGEASLYIYDHVTLRDSKAGGQGGGVQAVENSKVYMYGGEITNCSNWASVSGGVMLDENACFYLKNGSITNCEGYSGGGFCVQGNARLEMSGGKISGCRDLCEDFCGGGAVYLRGGGNSSFIMTGGIIENNSGKYGGGILLVPEKYVPTPKSVSQVRNNTLNERFKMTGGIVRNNIAYYGGGICVIFGDSTYVNNEEVYTNSIGGEAEVYNNTAKTAGDDIYVNEDAKLLIFSLPAKNNIRMIGSCGHEIDGWYDDSEEARWNVHNKEKDIYVLPVESGVIEGECGIKAAHPEYYTLKFETNSEECFINDVIAKKGSFISLEEYVPTREGFNFEGWHTDSELNTKISDLTLDDHTTVYAKWSESKDPNPGKIPTPGNETDPKDEINSGDEANPQDEMNSQYTTDSEEAKNLSNESNLKDETELGSVDKIYRTDTPKTGDDSNIFLWTSLFLSSIILINEVYVYSNKKKYRI